MARVARSVLVINPENNDRVIIPSDQDAPEWVERTYADRDDFWSPEWPPPRRAARERARASEEAGGLFDPGAHNLQEVRAYLDGLAGDDSGRVERDRVLDAERAGKARQGLVGE